MDSDEEKQYDEINFYKTEQSVRDSTPIYPNLSEITIGIEKRESRGNALKKHVAFLIKGEDRKGEVNVWRRFNEFHEMRLAMVRVWPGCLIPSLPSKNPLMKNEEEMNRKRERYLDDFLKKMAQRDYLYYSDEFQAFLRSETINVSEMFQKWATPTPLSIINRYKSTFSALDGKQISTKTVTQIFDFTKILEANNQLLISYRKMAKDLAFQRDRYNTFYRTYLTVIKSYEQNILAEYISTNSQSLLYTNNTLSPQLNDHSAVIEDLTKRNPYWLLYDLIKNEERDGRAFMELIYSIQYYGDKARNYHDKIESNIKGIGEVSAGKKNLKSLMSKGTNQQIKYQLEVETEELKKEKEQTQMLRDIVTALVAFVEIEQYKIFKRDFYLTTVRKLTKIESNFSEELTIIWNEVLGGLEKIAENFST